MKLSKILQKLQVRSYDTGITDSTIQLAQELEAMTQWQPIDSATKDGSVLLLWVGNEFTPQKGSIEFGSWKHDGNDIGELNDAQWFSFSGDEWSTGYYYTPLNPSYWMNLPKPPQAD